MLKRTFWVRGTVSALLLAPSVSLLWLSSCSSDPSSSTTGDGGCAVQCLDGTVADPGRKPQNDGAPTETGGADGSAPSDASDPSDATDGSDGQDAASDADPYADADTNCTHYVAPAGGTPASVYIVNQTAAPIYLGRPTPSCDPYVAFTFTDPTDASLPVATTGKNDCSELQSASCPPESCSVPLVVKLGAGKTYDVGWPGTVFVKKWMPPSCYADAACVEGPCDQQVAAPTGTLGVTAYSGFYCDGGPCPDCTIGASGNCTVFGATGVSGAVHSGQASYAAGATSVTVNIQ